MRNWKIDHKYIAAAAAILYILYSLGAPVYSCAALLGLTHALSLFDPHGTLTRIERAGACGLLLVALLALAMALGAGDLVPDPAMRAVHEVWV